MTADYFDDVSGNGKHMRAYQLMVGGSGNPFVFGANPLPNGEDACAWTSRDLYATMADSPGDLTPKPGVQGFTLIFWAYASSLNHNPSTSFPDYRVVQMGDDDVDATTAAAVAWYVDNGASTSAFRFVHQDVVGASVAMVTGWHMYAWTVDCAAGAAPVRGYRDGVLIATGAADVTTAIDTTVFRTPAVALGAHQGGVSKTLSWPTNEIGMVSIFRRALSVGELLAAHGAM